MFDRYREARDTFAFSLGGMTAIASFFPAQAIADDRINRIRDEHVRQARCSHCDDTRDWLDCDHQPAHDCA